MDNHIHSIALHYFHYNFCRKHQSIKTTPAVADHRWTMLEFVQMLEKEEQLRGGRITEYLPSPKSEK